MSKSSLAVTQAHFDAKARRYQMAIRGSPTARTLELLPFLMLLGCHSPRDVKDWKLADLLCGSGFLTSGLRGCFREVVGIDVSQGMLDYYPVSAHVAAIQAGLEEHTEVLRQRIKPDVIVALAGLHHVYEVDASGSINQAESQRVQNALLLNWAETLPREGIMVVADVTAPDAAVEYSKETLPCEWTSPQLQHQFLMLASNLDASLNRPLGITTGGLPRSLGEYVDRVLCSTGCTDDANPGDWFREVVESHGIYGHTDRFLFPRKLLKGLRDGGCMVNYYEIPTPWIFPSMDDFLFFFYHKFALGPDVRGGEPIEAVVNANSPDLVELVREHLGLHELPEGALAVGWRLGFYVVRPG